LLLLDLRNKELVNAAERALNVLESELATKSGITEMAILDKTDEQKCFLRTYSTILPALQLAVFVGFVAMAVFAVLWAPSSNGTIPPT
jgi:hypothetical protein